MLSYGDWKMTLRRALLGDALFETVCGLVFMVGASALAQWTGWDVPVLFAAAGIGLGAVAALLYWMATRAEINLRLARAVMILNAVFALGGIVALVVFWSSLADGARWLIGMIAVLVGVFAALEYAGLRSGFPAR